MTDGTSLGKRPLQESELDVGWKQGRGQRTQDEIEADLVKVKRIIVEDGGT